MIPADIEATGPFTVTAVVHDGHTRSFDSLADAHAYARRLADRLNVASATCNKFGALVSAVEVFDPRCAYEDGGQ